MKLATSSFVNTEDIILYTLNELQSSYNLFKTAIHTKLTLVTLEDLYALLVSEEFNLATKSAKDLSSTQNS